MSTSVKIYQCPKARLYWMAECCPVRARALGSVGVGDGVNPSARSKLLFFSELHNLQNFKMRMIIAHLEL